MQTWQQIYNPLDNLWLSSLVAAIPIIFFFVALAVFRMKGHVAGTITVALSLLVAILSYKHAGEHGLASAAYGFFYGLWPIAWIIVCAVFLYKITVKTGQFDIIRASVVSLTEDQRLQMLLVGFRLVPSWKARPALARRWPSPPRCWWAWASTRCTRPACA
jgi:L-lactate permease